MRTSLAVAALVLTLSPAAAADSLTIVDTTCGEFMAQKFWNTQCTGYHAQGYAKGLGPCIEALPVVAAKYTFALQRGAPIDPEKPGELCTRNIQLYDPATITALRLEIKALNDHLLEVVRRLEAFNPAAQTVQQK